MKLVITVKCEACGSVLLSKTDDSKIPMSDVVECVVSSAPCITCMRKVFDGGYEEGKELGYELGDTDGFEYGYNEGHAKGYDTAMKEKEETSE